MTTNRFGANCAVCGAAVAPGTGTVRGEVGARAVTHTSCEPLVRHTRSFTVRPWLLNEGTVTIKINFSDLKYELS